MIFQDLWQYVESMHMELEEKLKGLFLSSLNFFSTIAEQHNVIHVCRIGDVGYPPLPFSNKVKK